MKLVIFAYPLHYHISQLSYKQALVNLSNISEVVLIWDDLFRPQIEQQFQLIPQLKNQLKINVIPTSTIPFLAGQTHGWIRQQLVKLHLHLLFKNDTQWILLDGDTILRSPISVQDNNQHAIFHNDGHDYYAPAHEFNQHAIGYNKGEDPSFMTPLWLCERIVLEKLHQHIYQKHNVSLIELFKEFTQTHYPKLPWPPLNEVELYGIFASKVLKHPIILNYTHWNCVEPADFLNAWAQQQTLVLSGRDSMPDSFWDEQQIPVNILLNNYLNKHG